MKERNWGGASTFDQGDDLGHVKMMGPRFGASRLPATGHDRVHGTSPIGVERLRRISEMPPMAALRPNRRIILPKGGFPFALGAVFSFRVSQLEGSPSIPTFANCVCDILHVAQRAQEAQRSFSTGFRE